METTIPTISLDDYRVVDPGKDFTLSSFDPGFTGNLKKIDAIETMVGNTLDLRRFKTGFTRMVGTLCLLCFRLWMPPERTAQSIMYSQVSILRDAM